MIEVYKQIPLYRFLDYCNGHNKGNMILDCGAGGNQPPLSLFYENGYNTVGIEFSKEQLTAAQEYADKKKQNLNIASGDMRQLPFTDGSMDYVYSYNSVFHMMKKDVEKSVIEMKRVLKDNGLMFINFLSTKDFRFGLGPDAGYHEYEQEDDGIPVIHSYYEPNEAEGLFENMQIIYKEERVLERIFEGERIRQGFIDYILIKK